MRTAKAKGAETMADLGVIGALVSVGSWALERFASVSVPADVQLNAGVLLMVVGGTVARVIRARWRYGK
jgi:hypothetical protein